MQYYEGELVTTYKELTQGEVPLVKEGTLRSWLSRGQVRYARRAIGRGIVALIDYKTLPQSIRKGLVERYGLPEHPFAMASSAKQVYHDGKAVAYYRQYTYQGVYLTEDLVAEYTLNAGVLNTLIQEEKRLRLMGNKLNNNRTDIGRLLYELSESLRHETGHTLPKTERGLRDKLNKYLKEGYGSLINKRIGNNNGTKISASAGQYLIALKQSRMPVYGMSEIYELYNRVALNEGWKPLESIDYLRRWYHRPEVKILWQGTQLGEHEVYKLAGYKHQTVMPTRRNSLWYIDGTKLNLYYNNQGKLDSVVVVEVIDAATDLLLGYAIGKTECFDLVYRAVRMALAFANEQPYELVHDNQGGQTGKIAKEWLDRVSLHHRTTQPNRAQSKTIENLFGRLQREELARYPWFTGANITAKKASNRPNLEWLKANMNMLPTGIEELEKQYAECRERWNNKPHHASGKPRNIMYVASVNEALTTLEPSEFKALCMLTRPQSIRFTGAGLTLETDGEKYSYDAYTTYTDGTVIPDNAWRLTHIGKNFVVRYDPLDMQSIDLYSEDVAGKLRYERTLTSKIIIHRALQEQTQADAQFIRAVEKSDKALRMELEAERRAINLAYNVGKPTLAPQLKGMTNADEMEITRLAAERAEAIKQSGMVPELAQAQKEVSMETWDKLIAPTPVKEENNRNNAMPSDPSESNIINLIRSKY